MKNIIKLFILSTAVTLSSCEDFLEKTPLDVVSEVDFYSTPGDLRASVNAFYNDLPSWSNTSVGFSVLPDLDSDMGIAENINSRLSGQTGVATESSNSVWSWDEVREVNWLLDHVDQAEGDQTEIDQYIGETYFFRAYYYFNLLVDYGDLPIFEKYFDDKDEEFLFAARDPRNEVADFILSDLTTAISLLQSFPDISTSPRVSKEAALLLKARIALYEGTWERYHNGTAFGVEGSNGSTYLEIAADTSEELIDSGVFTLHDDYSTLFNQIGLSGNSEVMLWRDFDNDLGFNNSLQISWPNRCAYTREAIRTYLCIDGDPISVSDLYDEGDKSLATIEVDRDPRLAALIMVPGDLIKRDGSSTVAYIAPDFTTANAGLTGYESQKYRNIDIDPVTSDFTKNTSKVIMRYAEALLIFAEAKAELGTITQDDLEKSINKLRTRVGMPGITLGSITVDPDWPNYGYTLTDILYEVRRERTVELMAEGFRLDDLLRWRAHELVNGTTPRGAYFYDGIVNSDTPESNVTIDSEGYIAPFLNSDPYNFDETKAYLLPIPSNELILNPNLLPQNPGW
ncbi:RagB/SusD family nutrient uptake outer membrane protein [Algibacter sp. L3A6]|uniref:RagB/SusD family nutrient uptake outer membrane protein n=1 Tax=Algibacter sp. L3A6 TaxID=2686366 RepID=UPI00131EA8A8|nr:RagB/SusD family nutrient uptake outer membrane protein [Algibacter sp. L3A6]